MVEIIHKLHFNKLMSKIIKKNKFSHVQLYRQGNYCLIKFSDHKFDDAAYQLMKSKNKDNNYTAYIRQGMFNLRETDCLILAFEEMTQQIFQVHLRPQSLKHFHDMLSGLATSSPLYRKNEKETIQNQLELRYA